MRTVLRNFVHNNLDIRVVGIEGSGAFGKQDEYSDIDITFLTTNPSKYLESDAWLDVFGKRIIMQKPNYIDLGEGQKAFPYLMLFQGGNRIDLKIASIEALEAYLNWESSIQIVRDVDQRVKTVIIPSEVSFFTEKPSIEKYDETLNEFYWLLPYVIKGCARNQFLYAVEHLSKVREQLITVICWSIAEKYDYKLNLGSANKYLEAYMDELDWRKLKETFNCSTKSNIKFALVSMIELMERYGKNLADKYQYHFSDEYPKVVHYVYSKLEV